MSPKNKQILDCIENLYPLSNVESDYNTNGINVPRVTKIISRCIHNEGLMSWANSLGFKHKSYRDTLNHAASIGSDTHLAIDTFLEYTDTEDIHLSYEESNNAYLSFRRWYDDVSRATEGNIKILLHEETLVHRYFGGTLDGLYEINGKKYIIDYKTSNHITFNYCIQIAAYIFMLRELININIDGIIILQLSKNSVEYNEFMLSMDKENERIFLEQCEDTFISMLYYYYNLYSIEREFKKLYRE